MYNSTENKIVNQEQAKNNIAFMNDVMKMTTVEIAEKTGKQHKHVLRDTRKMLTELYGEESLPTFGLPYKAADGNTYTCYSLPKNEVLTLITGYSIPLRAKIIRRLDELENGKAPFRMDSGRKDSFELQLLGVKYASDILRCSDISRLQMVHAVHEYNQVPTVALPVYIEKVRVTFSAKDLLEKNGCGISTISFNKKMIAAGLMEEKERSSTKGKDGVKKFKALNEDGLKYGQNDTSKHNPRETQAHYFEDTFMELFGLIN